MDFAVTLYARGFLGLLLVICIYLIFMSKGLYHYLNKKKYYREILLTLAIIGLVIFMKMNVRIFAPQLITLEILYLSIGGLLQNDNIS